jgi:HKD family nuclease/diadenosine tetraphosphate (Ap4A) HIT family hydrolase
MSCPFCSVDESRIAFSNDSVIAIWDGFPVSPGHLLIIPRRHTPAWIDLSSSEKAATWSAIDQAQGLISERFHPDGFNVGFDENSAAGQTVFHFHLHIIPRYEGDVADPRGGVRHVIPNKANYLAADESLLGPPFHRRLVTGGADPLLPHLLLHLDGSTICDIAVAFLLDSGARMIVAHLRDFLARGGQARILVGDYLDVTEPAALRRLNDLSGDLTVRVYEARGRGFHLKTYIFQTDVEGIAFVGSSNLSAPALTTSIEWNYKVISRHEQAGFLEITVGFESIFNSYQAFRADESWICRYEARRLTADWRGAGVTEEAPAPMVVPHSIQQEALQALEETRREGYSAGLVVLATGLGKTWLSAFDSDRAQFRRVLFVAHREEILNQAIDNFRRVRPNSSIGRMIGAQKDSSADLVFASVQTLGRIEHLKTFGPTYFDYIIIDEFHHAAATTYRRIIDYFEPKFLLGLTATPERMDGGDPLTAPRQSRIVAKPITQYFRQQIHVFVGLSSDVDRILFDWYFVSLFKYRAAKRATCSTSLSIAISPGIASAEIMASNIAILWLRVVSVFSILSRKARDCEKAAASACGSPFMRETNPSQERSLLPRGLKPSWKASTAVGRTP